MAETEHYLRAPLWAWLLPFPIQVGANSVGSEVSPNAAIRIDIWHLRQNPFLLSVTQSVQVHHCVVTIFCLLL